MFLSFYLPGQNRDSVSESKTQDDVLKRESPSKNPNYIFIKVREHLV